MATYDADTAATLLANALAGTPALTGDQMTALLGLASSLADDGTTVVYTSADLSRAVGVGFAWKAAQTADQIDIGGQAGVDLNQWHQDLMVLSRSWLSGVLTIDGTGSTANGRIRSYAVVGTAVTP